LGADEDCADAAAHRLAITSPQINFFISVILFLRKVIFKHHNGRRGGKVHGAWGDFRKLPGEGKKKRSEYLAIFRPLNQSG
jgi:hypothetical protein